MCQVLVHVARDKDGTRRLTEIALLRRSVSGQVQAVPVWLISCGLTEHIGQFRAVLRDRVPA